MLKNTLYKITIISIIIYANCTTTPEPPKQIEKVQQVEDKLKERAEKLSSELQRQKSIKGTIADIDILEKFERTTSEKDIIKKLDKPDYVREIIVGNTPQKILYYTQKKYAIWLWKDTNYTYRATVSLNHGKFDLPLHNVMTEDELRLTARYFNESEAIPDAILKGLKN